MDAVFISGDACSSNCVPNSDEICEQDGMSCTFYMQIDLKQLVFL